jgi:hypothetical protein
MRKRETSRVLLDDGCIDNGETKTVSEFVGTNFKDLSLQNS